ncbi:MAG: ABC transporter transmembrane domain-containing protein [Waddliaceae bacterium]
MQPFKFFALALGSASRLIKKKRYNLLQESDASCLSLPKEIEESLHDPDFNHFPFHSSRALLLSLFKKTTQYSFGVFGLSVIWAVLATLTPVFIYQMLSLLNHQHITNVWSQAVGYSLAFLVLTILLNGVSQYIEWLKFASSQKVFLGLSKTMFSHSIKLSSKLDMGSMLNCMTIDVKNISLYLTDLSLTTFNLFVFVLGNIFLYFTLGMAGIVSVSLLILLYPVVKKLSSGFYLHDLDALTWRDKRISVLSKALTNIRILKAFNWERHIDKEVSDLRRGEMSARKKYVHNLARFLLITTLLNSAIIALTYVVYIYLGNRLTPEVAFSSLATLRLIRRVIETIPLCIGGTFQRLAASKRITNFCTADIQK